MPESYPHPYTSNSHDGDSYTSSTNSYAATVCAIAHSGSHLYTQANTNANAYTTAYASAAGLLSGYYLWLLHHRTPRMAKRNSAASPSLAGACS